MGGGGGSAIADTRTTWVCVHTWSQGFDNSNIFQYPPIFQALVLQRKQQQDLIVFEVFFLGASQLCCWACLSRQGRILCVDSL
jgi:hypothetical protein